MSKEKHHKKPEKEGKHVTKYFKSISTICEEEEEGLSSLAAYYRLCAAWTSPETFSLEKNTYCPKCTIVQINEGTCTIETIQGNPKRAAYRQKRIQKLRKTKKRTKKQERLFNHLIRKKFGFQRVTCTKCGMKQKRQIQK